MQDLSIHSIGGVEVGVIPINLDSGVQIQIHTNPRH